MTLFVAISFSAALAITGLVLLSNQIAFGVLLLILTTVPVSIYMLEMQAGNSVIAASSQSIEELGTIDDVEQIKEAIDKNKQQRLD